LFPRQDVAAQIAIELRQLIPINVDIGGIPFDAGVAILLAPQRWQYEQQGTDNKYAGHNPE
jgi:hypothetical protein